MDKYKHSIIITVVICVTIIAALFVIAGIKKIESRVTKLSVCSLNEMTVGQVYSVLGREMKFYRFSNYGDHTDLEFMILNKEK